MTERYLVVLSLQNIAQCWLMILLSHTGLNSPIDIRLVCDLPSQPLSPLIFWGFSCNLSPGFTLSSCQHMRHLILVSQHQAAINSLWDACVSGEACVGSTKHSCSSCESAHLSLRDVSRRRHTFLAGACFLLRRLISSLFTWTLWRSSPDFTRCVT